MNYDEMINGLADEMLEKLASDEDEYGYEDGYYDDGAYEDEYEYEDGYDDEDGYITEDDLDAMSDEELEALASAIYEEELEKTAGAKLDAVKGIPGKICGAAKNYGANMSGKEWRAQRKTVKALQKGGDDVAEYGNYANQALAQAKQNRNAARKKTLKAWGGTAAVGAATGGGAYGVSRLKNKGQEKAAAMYEEAQLYKQAAEETYQEAQMIQDAASLVFDYFEDEE